ncbi:MAG: hypothetical protein ACJ77K_18795 [Bacteroidia bacterium]
MDKYNLTSETVEFDSKEPFEGDLHIREEDKWEFDRTTLLTITDNNGKKIKIRVDWSNYSSTDTAFPTLIISETDKLFFGAKSYWGIIDLKEVKIDRQESCTEFWNFEKHSDSIVVIAELTAESLTLKGETIDNVPIDPPFDSKIFEDRIEFNSPVYGQQTLKLRK